MKRVLGLDLGTNSIGWALVSMDDTDKLQRIEGIGGGRYRLFPNLPSFVLPENELSVQTPLLMFL